MTNNLCQQIIVQKLGKRYNREWIFRGLNQQFEVGKSYALTGANGSGKSTLLQVLVGLIQPSEGSIQFENQSGQALEVDEVFKNVSLAAPYLELVEEMTAWELLDFHRSFKQLIAANKDILDAVQLDHAANKQIRYFSSGMKQRLKLAQAFFSDTPILLLDEPTTNLDQSGIDLYTQLIRHHTTNRMLIISSNDPNEYRVCQTVIRVEEFKTDFNRKF
jgi:ABC-type multidrug transport system ATPase subunit